VNAGLIPTGQLAPVEKTPMDFLKAKKVGKDIDQVKGGYDHNFVIDRADSGIALAASVYDEGSGRYMEVWTTQPGVQFYTGNFLDGSLTGRDGKRIPQHGALCLETQHFPDSPNHANFPSTELKPGGHYHTVTIFRFGVQPK
jgi:aldose 1-epimerase